MKKLLLISLGYTTLLLGSCSIYRPVINYIDYSSFAQQGVFLTESNSVSFEYQPLGSLQVLLYSGFIPKNGLKEKNKSRIKEDGIYYQSTAISSNFKDATLTEALDMAVEIAKGNGANGIINLRYEYFPRIKSSPGGWQITGMVIKK